MIGLRTVSSTYLTIRSGFQAMYDLNVRFDNHYDFFKFQLDRRFLILIPLILPIIDVLTDHIFAIQSVTQTSQAVAAIGCALLSNLVFGPMLFGKNCYRLWYLTIIFFQWKLEISHSLMHSKLSLSRSCVFYILYSSTIRLYKSMAI